MYCTVAEVAPKWHVSERQVRSYCKNGLIPGAFNNGGVWNIPDTAKKPEFTRRSRISLSTALHNEMGSGIKGGIYHKTQIELTYNSNHIEGSKLTYDQTRYIYETNTICLEENKTTRVDDIIETVNHFRCVDEIIKAEKRSLTEKLIKQLHYILKSGTSDSRQSWFAIGDYKQMPNEVGGMKTTDPDNVHSEMIKLLQWYNELDAVTLDDILEFHFQFERIHPFQDGNGRVGRLIMFKECLKNRIVPFIIEDDIRLYYYRGLKEWRNEKGYLRDTCLSCQDTYKKYLDYFAIKY